MSSSISPARCRRIAAGQFSTKRASKLLASFFTAKRLVVRLSGRTTQDATFDLAAIQDVASKVGGLCGISFVPRAK
jgi:hypothetical protein